MFPFRTSGPVIRTLSEAGLLAFPLPPSASGGPSAEETTACQQSLCPREGYWVYAPTATSFSFSGVPLDKAVGTSTSAVQGWRLFSASSTTPKAQAGFDRILRWDALRQRYVEVPPEFLPRLQEGYWGLNAKATERVQTPPSTLLKRPRAPPRLSATRAGLAMTLHWKNRMVFEDGATIPTFVSTGTKVYRNHELIAEVTGANTYADDLSLGQENVSYHLTAFVRDALGTEKESEASSPIHVDDTAPSPPRPSGTFEVPSPLTHDLDTQALPKTAIAAFDDRLRVHLVYVVRGTQDEGDTLQALKSDKAGKPGSFGDRITLRRTGPNRTITDLAIAARGPLVSVAWIERSLQAASDQGHSHLNVVISQDGGRRFEKRQELRSGASWKRSVSLAYDRLDHHHLVWNEASKVYYLKDLQGEASNVFDQIKRRVDDRVMHYKRVYAPKECDADPCGCPVVENERYRLGDEDTAARPRLWAGRERGQTPRAPRSALKISRLLNRSWLPRTSSLNTILMC